MFSVSSQLTGVGNDVKTTLMHAHYYTLIVIGATFLILFFVTSAFHTLMPQECVCGGGGGGGAEIFIYIRRLGPFLGVQNLEF